jgi:hypothetical protein
MIFNDQIGLSSPSCMLPRSTAFVAADVVYVIFMYQPAPHLAQPRRSRSPGYFFVLHVDERESPPQLSPDLLRHRRHRLADVTNFVRGNHRPTVVGGNTVAKIRRRKHSDNPGQGLRL